MPRIVRTFVTLLALFSVLLAGAPTRADDPPEDPAVRKKRIAEAKRKLEAEEREFATRVNKAIDDGWKWLKSKRVLNADGLFIPETSKLGSQNVGRQAIGIYTLLKCGSKASSKEVRRALSGLETLIDKSSKHMSYSVAVEILLYDALANPPPKGTKKKRGRKPKKQVPATYKGAHYRKIKPLVDWLLEKQAKNAWRYPGADKTGFDEDLSNTMYVVFALMTVDRCGIRIPSDVWRRVITYVLERQHTEGKERRTWVENPAWEPGSNDKYGRFLPGPKVKARGWAYVPDTERTGSMTTAGVFCLAAIRERLKAHDELDAKTRKAIDQSIRSGVAWMDQWFAVDKNPRQGGWHYYYLYGLERMGAVLGHRFIGQHDWYREGAEYLLKEQMKSGAWPPSGPESIVARYEDSYLQTVFALLFLKRASLPSVPIGPVVTGG